MKKVIKLKSLVGEGHLDLRQYSYLEGVSIRQRGTKLVQGRTVVGEFDYRRLNSLSWKVRFGAIHISLLYFWKRNSVQEEISIPMKSEGLVKNYNSESGITRRNGRIVLLAGPFTTIEGDLLAVEENDEFGEYSLLVRFPGVGIRDSHLTLRKRGHVDVSLRYRPNGWDVWAKGRQGWGRKNLGAWFPDLGPAKKVVEWARSELPGEE